jgi:tetratricopeptide (TPR) repeat protein
MSESDSDIRGEKEILKLVNTGVVLCRQGRWKKGLECLEYAMDSPESGSLELPPRTLAYLGYGRVRFLDRPQEGLELLRQAIDADFLGPDGYLYLAKAQVYLGNRGAAIATVEKGLRAVTPGQEKELEKLRQKLGRRQRPVLPFLSRSHPVNRFLGDLRHRLARPI